MPYGTADTFSFAQQQISIFRTFNAQTFTGPGALLDSLDIRQAETQRPHRLADIPAFLYTSFDHLCTFPLLVLTLMKSTFEP
jgi:hypothetical protein